MQLPKSNTTIVLMGLFVLCEAVSCANLGGTNKNPVWAPDNGNGTYKNPVIFADYSDPDVIRVGDDFYLASSSFNCSPGLPVLHSKDLVNWTIIGHVFQKHPSEIFNSPQHGNGVWAPSIRYHDGEFYVYYGDPDLGIFMAKAKNPAPAEGGFNPVQGFALAWEPLVLVKEGKGRIDTCPFWDDDGNAYLVHAWAKSRAGINSILTICRMSPDGTKLLDEGKTVFDGQANQPTIEGPKMYKRNGYYYIFAPAGGVRNGWQTVLRSKNVFGPYEDKVVLDQGKTEINGPHQGGWVELESGESWFVHFQDRGPYGRVVHLQPVKWVNDWPVIGIDKDGDGKGEPVLSYKKPDPCFRRGKLVPAKAGSRTYPVAVPQTSDEFDSNKPGLQWQWHANYQDRWMSLAERPGWLRLFSVPIPDKAVNLWSVPNLILQKFPAPEFTVTTKVDFSKLAAGQKAGLVIMGADYSYLAVEKTSTGCRLIKRTCKNAGNDGRETEEGNVDCAGDLILLRVKVDNRAVCNFSYSRDGKEFTAIGESFTAQAGRWIGAKVGLFCLTHLASPAVASHAKAGGGEQKPGYAYFDWFRFD